MTGNKTEEPQARLDLRSRLSDIARIPAWIESLASKHGIPEKVQFAINLCLEEVVSNIIRHGYAGESDRAIGVDFSMPQPGSFIFVVNDNAPQFNPLGADVPPAFSAGDSAQAGGQGIRLLREFADALEYERTPNGNRLRMHFSALNHY